MSSPKEAISLNRRNFPESYVMVKEGDPEDDANYEFVGIVTASYTEGLGEDAIAYRLGATALSQLVCDRTVFQPRTIIRKPVPKGEIPVEAIQAGIKEGVDWLPQEVGANLLQALGVSLPEGVEALSPEEFFDVLSQFSKNQSFMNEFEDHWNKIKQDILKQHGLFEE